MSPAEPHGFFESLLGPDAGDEVIGRPVLRQEVHRDLKELTRRPPLQEQHLVVRWDAADLTTECFGLFVHSEKRLATMRVFENSDARVSEREQVVLCLFQHRFRQHGRASGEVPNPLSHPSHFLGQPCGLPVMRTGNSPRENGEVADWRLHLRQRNRPHVSAAEATRVVCPQ